MIAEPLLLRRAGHETGARTKRDGAPQIRMAGSRPQRQERQQRKERQHGSRASHEDVQEGIVQEAAVRAASSRAMSRY